MIDINIPVLIFGSMIAVLIGSAVHLIAGGKLIRLVFCAAFALIGFWLGNFISIRTGFDLLRYGTVDYGVSIISSIFVSVFGFWLSGESRNHEQ